MDLPPELNELSSNYRSIDTSINQIKSVLRNLDNDEIITELRLINSEINKDLSIISMSLDSFTDDFNTTVAMFKGIDRSLDLIYGVYNPYNFPIEIILFVILSK